MSIPHESAIGYLALILVGMFLIRRAQRVLWRRTLQRPTVPALQPGTGQRLPYSRQQNLLSDPERCLYEALQGSIGTEFLIFPKVRLLDVLALPEWTPNRDTYLNRIVSKHIDFLVCDRTKLGPMVAVELEEPPQSALRPPRDDFVDEALRAAGLPLLRLPAKAAYASNELAGRIRDALGACPALARSGTQTARLPAS